jgi:hypothetical protein
MSYLLYKNENQTGPFTLEELQKAVSNGDVSPSDLVWKEGMSEWKSFSAVIPPPVHRHPPAIPGMPPLPTQTQDVAPASQSDPLAGNIFLIAKVPGPLSKNEYDVINAETAKVVVQIREADAGFGTKLLRLGKYSGISKYAVTLSDPSGAIYMHLRGGGMGGHSEVFKPDGAKMGEIKKTSLINLNFEAFAEEGVLFRMVSKGLAGLVFSQKILDKENIQIGAIDYSSSGDAKKLIGERIRLLDSNYDYAFQVDLSKSISPKQKVFLFAANYQLTHVRGK